MQRIKHTIFAALTGIMMIVGMSMPVPALGQGLNADNTGLTATASAAGLSGTQEDVFVIIGQVIRVVIGLLGVFVLGLLIYGGFLWMTAQGDPARVKKAINLMVSAVIGAVVVLSSFALSNFIISQAGSATQGGVSADSSSSTQPAP